jgi:8-oxo-dGTP pyrophosphatase MutT (NUDIX family)
LNSEPRPSASVILVRDGPDGLECFMVRRHARSPAAPSAYVFPGGTVRDDDFEVPTSDMAPVLSERSDSPVESAKAAAFYVCAVRELFEEAGVLLVLDAAGALLQVDPSDTGLQERLESTRLALQARELAIGGVLRDQDWHLALDLLVPFSHWITPRALAARFDTRFFVAELPPGQSALHDTIETSEGIWLAPSRALEADYHTVYATTQHLRRIIACHSVRELFDFARRKQIRMVSPEMLESGEGMRVMIRPDVADAW